MPIWRNTELIIFIVQCVVIWGTLLTAIIMCARYKGEGEDLQETVAKANKESAGKKADSLKPNVPMLNFVTVDEIYSMGLEELQSVPEEQIERLPLDKKMIVKRRINELIQAERAKKNK